MGRIVLELPSHIVAGMIETMPNRGELARTPPRPLDISGFDLLALKTLAESGERLVIAPESALIADVQIQWFVRTRLKDGG